LLKLNLTTLKEKKFVVLLRAIVPDLFDETVSSKALRWMQLGKAETLVSGGSKYRLESFPSQGY
jgi:hypothetical protein